METEKGDEAAAVGAGAGRGDRCRASWTLHSKSLLARHSRRVVRIRRSHSHSSHFSSSSRDPPRSLTLASFPTSCSGTLIALDSTLWRYFSTGYWLRDHAASEWAVGKQSVVHPACNLFTLSFSLQTPSSRSFPSLLPFLTPSPNPSSIFIFFGTFVTLTLRLVMSSVSRRAKSPSSVNSIPSAHGANASSRPRRRDRRDKNGSVNASASVIGGAGAGAGGEDDLTGSQSSETGEQGKKTAEDVSISFFASPRPIRCPCMTYRLLSSSRSDGVDKEIGATGLMEPMDLDLDALMCRPAGCHVGCHVG